MYMLIKTCFILIARFTLGIKEFFQCDKISYYQFFANIFSDIFFPFFNVECVHLFVTNECVYLDDRTSYLEHYRDVIHVYFKFLCNETGCKVINMIYRYWFITNHDWWSVMSASEGGVPQHCVCRSISDVSPQWAQPSKIDDKFLLFVNVKDLKCVGTVFLCVLVYWEINSSSQDVISFLIQRGGYSVEEVLQYQPNDMSSCLTACHLCCWSFCKCGSFMWLINYCQKMWMNFIQVLVAI